MWSLNLDRVRSHFPSGASLPRVAIETGTARGNGARALARIFEKVITIELSPELHRAAQTRFGDPTGDPIFSRICCVLGNSADCLPTLFEQLDSEESVFIFLDAHWSGDSSVTWSGARWQGYGVETAHLGLPGAHPTGPEQCPLLDELQAVMKCWPGRAWILIDDLKNIPPDGAGLRNHEFPGEDWSHLSRAAIRAIVQGRLEECVELKDPEQWLLRLGPRS